MRPTCHVKVHLCCRSSDLRTIHSHSTWSNPSRFWSELVSQSELRSFVRTSGFLCGAITISQRDFVLSSQSKEKSSELLSTRCSANEQTTISILLSSEADEMASRVLFSAACIFADERLDRSVIDDGNAPSATSLNDSASQDRPVLCLNASNVYLERWVIDDDPPMNEIVMNYRIGSHEIWLGKFWTHRYNRNFTLSLRYLYLGCIFLWASVKALSRLEPLCESYRRFTTAWMWATCKLLAR